MRNPVQIVVLLACSALLAGCSFDNGNDGGAADTTPDAFGFTAAADVPVSTVITSPAVAIEGISGPAPVSVTGGSYSIGCGADFTAGAGTISNGETVCVRHTSAAATTTTIDTILTVGGVAATFSSTTAIVPDPALTSGLKTISAVGDNRTYYLDLPTDYAESTEAKPLIIGYHGTGLSHADWLNGRYPLREVVGDGAILIYPDARFNEAAGYTQWDAARDAAMFEALLASLPGTLRFDPDRIFITGHSSGAGFANVIGCDYGDRIRAIAPVVGTLTDFSCKGSFAVLDIVGSKDPLASISRVAHDYWVRYNGYDVDVTTPGPVPPCEDHAAGAVDYPVLWCLHDEGEGPTPDVPAGTAHAWPAFASEAVWTFFSGLSRLAPRVEPPPGGGNAGALGNFDTTMSFTLHYPADIPSPLSSTIVLFPPGLLSSAPGQQPAGILSFGFDLGAAVPGSDVTYQVPVRYTDLGRRLTFPASYTAAVFIYVEGGSSPQPAEGVDHAVFFPIEAPDKTTPIVAPGVLTLEPFRTIVP